MARFAPKTFTTILNRIINRLVSRSDLEGLEDGGPMHTIASAFAREMDDANFQMINIRKIWSIFRAVGRDLDERARDYGPDAPVRRTASRAVGNLQFGRTGTTGTASIPIGATARVPGGAEFRTTAAGSILNGSTTSGLIASEAVQEGASGNVSAGTVTALDGLPGIETVTNPANFSGGEDEESAESFRSRVVLFLRSLARGTPQAIRFAVLGVSVSGLGSIRSASIIQERGENLGRVKVYVDNGTGTIASSAVVTNETVIASAGGGEVRFSLGSVPLVPNVTRTINRNAVALVEGTDFTLHEPTGEITLDSTQFPNGLTVADTITASYTHYTGLLQEGQKVVDGDPSDSTTYPGYAAAGVSVAVLPPIVLQQSVTGVITPENGFAGQLDDLRLQAEQAVINYINSLGVNDDVILSSMIAAVRAIPGIFDVRFITPTSNVVIGEPELARATTTSVDIN